MFKFIGIVLAVFYVGLWLLLTVFSPHDDIDDGIDMAVYIFLAVLYGLTGVWIILALLR